MSVKKVGTSREYVLSIHGTGKSFHLSVDSNAMASKNASMSGLHDNSDMLLQHWKALAEHILEVVALEEKEPV